MLVLARTPFKSRLPAFRQLCRVLSPTFLRPLHQLALKRNEDPPHKQDDSAARQLPEHAVISTFDLFSIGGELCRSSPVIASEGKVESCSRAFIVAYSRTYARWEDFHQ